MLEDEFDFEADEMTNEEFIIVITQENPRAEVEKLKSQLAEQTKHAEENQKKAQQFQKEAQALKSQLVEQTKHIKQIEAFAYQRIQELETQCSRLQTENTHLRDRLLQAHAGGQKPNERRQQKKIIKNSARFFNRRKTTTLTGYTTDLPNDNHKRYR